MTVTPESTVVRMTAGFLAQIGYGIRLEVPNMGQSADLVATKNRWVTFVEAKTSNWRRALDQCQAHELVADFICIAIATVRVSDRLRAEAHQRGYGVIHCCLRSGRCGWSVPPRLIRRVWRPQRALLGKALRRIPHGR